MKTRKKLSLKFLGDVWIHLTELHLCFVEYSINTVFEEPEKGFLDRIEAFADKGNIIRSKREGSFLRNRIAMCECNSQSYTFLFSDQFVNTVFGNLQFGIS